MPVFRYQARYITGVPVYGSMEADDEESLRSMLQARGLTLQHAGALSIDSAMQSTAIALPRFYQLRVGERIREAFLTGLPPHEAVRAMAAEPFEHPFLSVMPMVFIVSLLCILPALGWILLVPGSFTPAWIMVTFSLLIVPLVWAGANWFLDSVPRRHLTSLADRLESGDSLALQHSSGLPTEVRSVMASHIPDQSKALAVAELIPSLMGSRFYDHRLLFSMFGSFATLMLLGPGYYWAMWQIVPQFRSIFEDFGMELPFLTTAVLQFSAMFTWMGLSGFIALMLTMVGVFILGLMTITSRRMAEFVSSVPVVGTPFSWLMQARVARVLAAMLNYDCDRAESLKAAAAASGFVRVQREGEVLSAALSEGRCSLNQPPEDLSALPLVLLTMPHDTEQRTGESSSRMSVSFTAVARMLEQASLGQGQFLGMVFQQTMTVLAGISIGIVVIGLFFPLIKLLNALAGF